jgi:aromatic-L-amino-acid decarboxylase
LAPVPLNLVCYWYNPEEETSLEKLNELNKSLEQNINSTGNAYITHTKLNGKYTLRMCIGQTNVEKKHVDAFWTLLNEHVSRL